jgi:hypothetical protein
MTKRQKFVLSSLLLAAGFFGVQLVDFDYRYQAILGMSFFSVLLSLWALKDGLGKNATLLTLILPVFFTSGALLFYLGLANSGFFSVLPEIVQYAMRLFLVVIYLVGIYALFLTSNIYTVATARTIQLLRAAHAVGFLLTLLAGFFVFNSILSFRFDFWINALSLAILAFPLFLEGFWSIELEHKLSREVLIMSAALAFVVGEVAAMIGFWPITVPVGSLALTTVVYIGLGLGQAKLQQRLFDRTIREYLVVGVVVFITMFITARWGG